MADSVPTPDATLTVKPHYDVLDGLRGTAALMVVLFHIMGMTVSWSDQGQWLHHAALAVDFFFLLSGFVIAYAYDDRWGSMTIRQFVAVRLVRLHPLVVLGAVLGLISFLIDPSANNQRTVPISTVLFDFAVACLLLPYPALPNRWTDTHSLNSPAWSLLQEYIGNLAYALILRRLGTRVLGAVVVASGAVLAWAVWDKNSFDLGSYWETLWQGTARMVFSFTFGLWLYRIRGHASKLRLGWLAASAVLVALFAVPLVPKTLPDLVGAHGNGLYETVVVMGLFPLLILSGAHSEIGRLEMRLCKWAGRLSYPVYILHYPFLLLYMNYVTFKKPAPVLAISVAAVAFVVVIAFSWVALKLYDEPLRRRLKGLIGRA